MPKIRGLNKGNKLALLRRLELRIRAHLGHRAAPYFLCSNAGKYDKQGEKVFQGPECCISFGPKRAYMHRILTADGIGLGGMGFDVQYSSPELRDAAIALGCATDNGRRLAWLLKQIKQLEDK